MSNVSRGRAFEEEVEQILRLKGYAVTRNNLISGTQIDLHATRNDPLDNISFVVECADREAPIGVDLVKEKASVLLSLRDAKSLYKLLFVSKSGFTAEAKESKGSGLELSVFDPHALQDFFADWK